MGSILDTVIRIPTAPVVKTENKAMQALKSLEIKLNGIEADMKRTEAIDRAHAKMARKALLRAYPDLEDVTLSTSVELYGLLCPKEAIELEKKILGAHPVEEDKGAPVKAESKSVLAYI